MTHIVTGGAGLIGSHLVDALVARGEKVRVIDNYIRGSMENLRESMRTGQVTVKTINLEQTGIPFSSDDVVWHLAARETESQYETLRINLFIDCNVIESVRKQKPKLFIYAGIAGKEMVRHLYKEHNQACVIVRFFEECHDKQCVEDIVVTLLKWHDFMLTPQTFYESKCPPEPFVANIGLEMGAAE